jgi:hypothetical protein
MAELRRQGIAIDDDNDPAPENIPVGGEEPQHVVDNLNWKGEEGIICPRKAANLPNSFAGFTHYSRDAVQRMSKLDLFMILFPVKYLKEVLIPETNKGLDVSLDMQEFIKWVGCWLYMSCWNGVSSRRDWWSVAEPSMDKGAPFRFHHVMSRKRFDDILSNLRYTNVEVPYEDGFLHMRQLEEFFNDNMAENFFPAWINVLDESMMEWFNKWAPGFMCVGRKPHPFGNERHTISCALTTILWRAQIVEGKDRPAQLRNGQSWEKLLDSCFECVNPSLGQVSVLCLIVDSVLQKALLHWRQMVFTLVPSSRSVNTGPRVCLVLPLIGILPIRRLVMWTWWR